MFNHLQQVLRDHGPSVLFPLLLIVVWLVVVVRNFWCLLTGGPRALMEPGAPYLYDRLYFVLWVVFITGWAAGMISGATEMGTGHEAAPVLFLIGWGVGAIGIGSLFALRGDMIMRGYRYNGRYGPWWRMTMSDTQLDRWERFAPFRKAIGGLFMVVGTIVLAVNLRFLPEAMASLQAAIGQAVDLLG